MLQHAGNHLARRAEVAGEPEMSDAAVGLESTSSLIVRGLGGRENIRDLDCCATRLRVTVKNPDLVADKDAWKAEGALGLVKKETGIQAIYGPKADVLKSDINDIL